jgi:hypothetical protein
MTTDHRIHEICDRARAIAATHFERMWAERHCERTHTFANGTIYDRTARRECIRHNIAAQRATEAYREQHA